MNIDFGKIRSNNIEEAKTGLDKFAHVVKAGVKSRTPEDTGSLEKSIYVAPQIQTQFQIKQSVKSTNKTYLPYVEYGVLGRTYNYNKPKGNIFYVGVGAAMFRRTFFDLKDKYNQYV